MDLLDKLLGHELDPDNYADVQTMFGRAQVYDAETDDGSILRILDIDDTWQSATYVDERWSELAFPYHQVFDRALALENVTDVLMLGGGALSWPKHVVTHTSTRVDVVEIDPQVIDLARTWFLLDRLTEGQQTRLCVHCTDAMTFLEDAAAHRRHYDLIVNDLFAAEEPLAALMTAEGATLLKSVLNPEGIYVANVVSALKGRKKRPLQRVKGALQSSFSQVEVVSLGADEPRIPDNNVVFATNGDYTLSSVLGV